MEVFRSVWRRDGEAGFSILESVVALVIVFGTILVLLRAMDGSIRVVNESRRQTAAAALASELLERARSLEWENVGLTGDSNDADCPNPVPVDGVAGVGCADWAAEFGIVSDGAGGWLFEGERIVFANGPTFDPFLSFHDQQIRDNVTYNRFLFVTQQTDAVGEERYRKITAIVQWTPPNGFPRQVRQVTYASAFEAPPSPVLDANIDFSTAAMEFEGFMGGTSGWLDPAAERPLLLNGTFLNGLTAHARAVSDYVSEADIEVSSPASEWVWATPLRTRIDSDVFTLTSDDDFGTSAPPSPADVFNQPLARWTAPGVVPFPPDHQLFGLEGTESGNADNSEVITAIAHAQDASDDLPLVSLEVAGPNALYAGTPEYGAALAAMYGEGIGSYDFIPVGIGMQTNGNAYDLTAAIDRFSTTDASRRVDASFTLDAEEYVFFNDTVYAKVDPQYTGWIRIAVPSVSGTLSAGEAALAPSLTTGDIEIQVWDDPAGNYVTVFGPVDYASLSGVTAVVPPFTTLPMGSTVGIGNWPDIEITVTIEELNVNGPLVDHTTYMGGAIETATIQFPSIVTGTLRYQVFDVTMGRMLFDYALGIQLPGVDASAAYINPDL